MTDKNGHDGKKGRISRKIVHRAWNTLNKFYDWRFPTLNARLSEDKKEAIKELLQPGDVLLLNDDCRPLGQLTSGLAGSLWTHSGFYVGDGGVVDVGTRPVVARWGIDEFLKASDVAVYRPQYVTDNDRKSAVQFINDHLGKPFNRNFNPNSEDTYYCAQLIASALKSIPHAINVPNTNVLGRIFITPQNLADSEHLKLVYISKRSAGGYLMAHGPTIAPTMLGAVWGARLGVPGAVLGAGAGLAVAYLLGNTLKGKSERK